MDFIFIVSIHTITISSNLIETTFGQISSNLTLAESMEYTCNADQVAVIPAILLASALLFAHNLQTITINAFYQCPAIAHYLLDLVLHVEFVSITRSIISTVFCEPILIVDVYNASDVILIMRIMFRCLMARMNDPSSNMTTRNDERIKFRYITTSSSNQLIFQIPLKITVT